MKFNLLNLHIPAPVKTVIKLVILAIIITLIVRKIDEKLLLDIVGHANPLWIIWALVWYAASKVLSAFRFNTLLRNADMPLTGWQNLRLYWLCMYYNLLLPGGISGDGYKIKLLMDRFGTPFKRILTLTLMDRISGLIALGQLSLLLLLYVSEVRQNWFFIIPLFVLSIGAAWIIFRWMVGPHIRVWMITSFQSIGVQGAQAIAALGLVFALGEGMHWPDYLVLFLVSSVMAMLPITIGGAGARELTFLYGATYLQVHAEKAVVIGFMFYVISTAVAFFGIIFSFKNKAIPGGHMPIASTDTSEPQ